MFAKGWNELRAEVAMGAMVAEAGVGAVVVGWVVAKGAGEKEADAIAVGLVGSAVRGLGVEEYNDAEGSCDCDGGRDNNGIDLDAPEGAS